MKTLQTISLLALAASLAACASDPNSKQLVDARTVMDQASNGRAAKYAPDDLLEARKLLDKAEASDDGSPEEVHYAYLADREARRAESRGSSIYYQEQEKAAGEKYTELQEKGRLTAQEQLDRSRKELAEIEAQMKEKDANVTALSARKAELEASQQRLTGDLEASEKARKDAEARANAALASLASLAAVKEEANETVITLSGQVLFKTGESTLLPIAQDSLARVATALKEMPPERKIVVEGHTDSVGDDEKNRKLSQARAESVVSYLASQGVEAERLTAVGRGEAEPVAKNDTPEGRANNRRVELIINKAGAEPRSAAR